MAERRFASLSQFLDRTKGLERRAVEKAVEDSMDKEVTRILSESSVTLSVYKDANMATKSTDTAEFIQKGIAERVAENSTKLRSILDELFADADMDEQREIKWVSKLCDLFNIPSGLDYIEKKALIDKRLAEDDDTLSYVTYLFNRECSNKR